MRIGGVLEVAVLETPAVISIDRGVDKPATRFEPGAPIVLMCVCACTCVCACL